MNIKELFKNAENGTLTFEQFESVAKEKGAKFTDLSEGKYVSKSKYDDDLGAKDKSIDQLNSTITQRDTDLEALKTQLTNAGTDADKLSKLQSEFDTLQGKYTSDMQAYQQQLEAQRYEFAVKEFANGKDFSSQAAKRDFIRALMDEKLKMKDDVIIGADDFTTAYTKDNADAFVVKQEVDNTPKQDSNKPHFVSSTPGTNPNTKPSLTEMMRAANESQK